MENEVKKQRALPWVTLAITIILMIAYTALSLNSALEFERYLTLGLFIGAIALSIVVIILNLVYKVNRNDDSYYDRIESIGSRYTIYEVVLLSLPLLIEVVGAFCIPDFYDLYSEHTATFALIMTVVVSYFCAFPLLALSSRKLPKMVIAQRNMGAGVFFACVAMTAGLAMIGTLIGSPIHTALTKPFTNGEETYDVAKIVLETTLWERGLVVGVLAPIFEELLFRKILIDRTIGYGQSMSIVLSGVMFGLFHGNFQQFFFATLIGMLFALVYIRTGRIRYTIFLHMAVNLTTSVVTVSFAQKILPYMEDIDSYADLPSDVMPYFFLFSMWIMFLIFVAILGVIFLIVWHKRLKPVRLVGEPSAIETLGGMVRSPLFWCFTIITLLHFIETYLPDIVAYVI